MYRKNVESTLMHFQAHGREIDVYRNDPKFSDR